MKKADLRKLFLQKMLSLSKDEHDIKSKKIARLFASSFDITKYSSIHVFLPIMKNNEVNTWYIINEIKPLNPDLSIIVPKSDFKTFEMASHKLGEETELVESISGILEPSDLNSFDEREIDIILIPLLAYDERGFRVGYGKGFYDRFLTKCRQDIIKVGVSFFEPVKNIQDVNENDVPLNFCITPEKVISFN